MDVIIRLPGKGIYSVAGAHLDGYNGNNSMMDDQMNRSDDNQRYGYNGMMGYYGQGQGYGEY